MSTIIDAAAQDRADMLELQAGRERALDRLMERHATPLFHYLCRLTGNEADAGDLAQETFVRVFQARERYRPGEKFTTWLYAIATNLARNQHRWRVRHPNVSLEAEPAGEGSALGETLPATTPEPAANMLDQEQAGAVRAAVAALPAEMREAMVLCEWEERSVAEAAAILETTPKAVESRLYRARQVLREKLRSWL